MVSGYENIMQHMIKTKKQDHFIYNLGSQYNYTVLEVCNIFLNEINKQFLKPIVKNDSNIEIPYQKLDYKKIKKQTGWKPKMNFKTGIKLTYEWYLRNYKKVINK